MGHHTDGHRYAGQEPVDPYPQAAAHNRRNRLVSHPFREAVHRDDGTQLAEFGLSHGRALFKMYAPDGVDQRRATWSLTAGELQRLADAADKAGIEMACQDKLSDQGK